MKNYPTHHEEIAELMTMRNCNNHPLADIPVMLSIAGHDPCGGAGIQADIESAAAFGVHTATVITCLTVQDSVNVHALEPVSTELLKQQIETLLADIPINSCKIGLIGSAETAELLASLLKEPGFPPVVFDPVLAAGGGTDLSGERLLDTIRRRLIPSTTILTPNLPEAQRLTNRETHGDCAAELIQGGCANVFITGGHDDADTVINRLYNQQGLMEEWEWPRLPNSYHGSGCTLAAAIAALLAKGVSLRIAVEQAQHFSLRALTSAVTIGRGQLIPKRIEIY